ncbi:hypothetical protein [uncultured Thiohalocapsa sp.]|uniref:hypothetical protein n=1 Tax=uncultured Thiohalocapsa sp. TaxID=768990 RepID=UPI0025FA9DD3|nr:hypothetical protein [uncultured Thiohalocapsa sp.]
MTSLSQLAELHVREFVSRLKRQDEINAEDRTRRPKQLIERVRRPISDWRQSAINCAGPLCLLDAVGQAEESWVEVFEHAPRCELPVTKPKPRLHRSFDGELHRDDTLTFA